MTTRPPKHGRCATCGRPIPASRAGEPLPAVCVDEVWLPVEVMRELRDCIAERVRWFEGRGRAVPAATRDALGQVERAIEIAAGTPDPIAVQPRDTALARAAVRLADRIESGGDGTGHDDLDNAALAFARSLSKADRERLGR